MFDEVVSVEVVRRFCEMATRRLGVVIEPKLEPLVAARVAKRLGTLQLPVDEYLLRLDDDLDCDEIVQFLDFVRPRPPQFFARWADLAKLNARMRQWLAAGRRRMRLWSAGCGSGEEAYSMALVAENAIRNSGVDPGLIDLKILATDISPRILDQGKRGLFDDAQVEGVPKGLRGRCFTRTLAGLALAEDVKARVVFRRLNLASPPYPVKGLIDAIFCHEALSSLVPAARTRVLAAAKSLLPDDGLLCTDFDDEAAAEPSGKEESLRSHTDRTPRWSGHC